MTLFNDVPSALTAGSVHLKLENTQALGSFKLRGLITQMHAVSDQLKRDGRKPNIVTMSAGREGHLSDPHNISLIKCWACMISQHRQEGLIKNQMRK